MALLVPALIGNNTRLNSSGGTELRGNNLNERYTGASGASVQASATPHALTGTPTAVVNSTDIEAEWIRIHVHGMSNTATNTNGLLNIYFGAAGSEVLVIDSLAVGWAPTADAVGLPNTYWFPMRIPRGTRISAELRALIASDLVRVSVEYGASNGLHWVGSGVETLGEDTANSRGTSITPATTGSGWTTIGTTGRRYRYIQVSCLGNNDTTAAATWLNWYLGTGSAILGHGGFMLSRIDSIEAHSFRDNGRWVDIPSGTSLQLNVYSSAAPSGLIYAMIHGVY